MDTQPIPQYHSGQMVLGGPGDLKMLRAPRRTRRGDAFLNRARRVLDSDDVRFDWLLRLMTIDIDRLSPAEIETLYLEAWFIVEDGQESAVRPYADTKIKIGPKEYDFWKLCQRDVKRFLMDLVTTNFHHYDIFTGEPAPNFSEQWVWLFFRHGQKLRRRFLGTLRTRLVLACADLLDRLGADRLKRCPLKVNDKSCGRLFLARRAQKFCSRQHASRAAWLRWLQRHHGGTRAKS